MSKVTRNAVVVSWAASEANRMASFSLTRSRLVVTDLLRAVGRHSQSA